MERQHDPVARIHRLIRAFGNGPHAEDVDLWHQLRVILKTLEDDQAVRLVSPPPSRHSRGGREIG